MAYRNGIVADTLRKAGMPYKIIFGLQLPQLMEIARYSDRSPLLAHTLWEDENVRESRLLACMIFSPEDISREEAENLSLSVKTVEEADILCFYLLRKIPFKDEFLDFLLKNYPERYITKALKRNLEALKK